MRRNICIDAAGANSNGRTNVRANCARSASDAVPVKSPCSPLRHRLDQRHRLRQEKDKLSRITRILLILFTLKETPFTTTEAGAALTRGGHPPEILAPRHLAGNHTTLFYCS
jgi:hypothetical protein